ncbi:MJ1255/VC2487 family glycosyltransferase [Psychrosphaera aestuarii]|uniref:MJ1255/VC2487 family glycosyltransferase n=1 Tax=Psychrosphaera aestuarii TaxID=1266052 RepID=UPI001B31F464|nr:MJ1255/VC2487 family glycosyltransferase [Psychrosphaera aestuarii]
MKILYGVQGTGNGHITRARVMAKALAKKGITVDYVFSGRPEEQYFDMEVFGNYRTYKGLSFVSEHGSISYLKTVKQASLFQLYKDIVALNVDDYDLVLNDFEPISAWAATRAGKKVINISHQAVFTKDQVPSLGLSWLNRQILKNFAPSDIALGVHWFHYGQSIMPPFIEREPVNKSESDNVLVYMPFEELCEVVELLETQLDQEFVLYHPSISAAQTINNITYRVACRQGFLSDLERSKGVIANAGFELSSEALCSGKKLLLKPLQGQFEQESNAETLRSLGLATVIKGLDESELERWLELPANEAINYPSDPMPVVDWLISGDHTKPEILCQQLWKSISLPQFSRSVWSK